MKSSTNIVHAHDLFFRKMMSDKRVARDFFETHLPTDLCKITNLDTLEMQSETFIDDMRRESIVDILFKVEIDSQPGYLYLLVDHQSKPDELMPFRIIKYKVNIIERHLSNTKSTKIPLVIPLVVYHGKEKWKYPTDINDLVDAPKELVNAYFLKSFNLIDLNVIDDEVLKEHIWSGAMTLTLKRIFSPDMQPYLHVIVKTLKLIEHQNGRNLIESVIVYILNKGNLTNKKPFIDLLNKELSSEIGGNAMTILEQSRMEGMQQGMQRGMQQGMQRGMQQGIQQGMQKGKLEGIYEGKLEIAKHLLDENHPIEFIERITKLSAAQIRALQEKATH